MLDVRMSHDANGMSHGLPEVIDSPGLIHYSSVREWKAVSDV